HLTHPTSSETEGTDGSELKRDTSRPGRERDFSGGGMEILFRIRRSISRHLTPPRIFILSFALLILVGAIHEHCAQGPSANFLWMKL
ncbi:MAG: hypothetical protein KKG96_03660, partial [Proteobacteria bacterium]|nr:hypothetical protein [Pseudomonadota bacterium]